MNYNYEHVKGYIALANDKIAQVGDNNAPEIHWNAPVKYHSRLVKYLFVHVVDDIAPVNYQSAPVFYNSR